MTAAAPSTDYPLTFLNACRSVLDAEGGYSNDPHDPGGETRYGISKRAYPDLNIAALTPADAIAIYYADYWLPSGCAHLPLPLAHIVFDCAVNQGVPTAIRMLQRALGVGVDGVIGTQTIAAAAASGRQVLKRLTTARIIRYADRAGFPLYGEGWVNRSLEAYARAVLL